MRYKTVFIDWYGTLSSSIFWDKWIGDVRYELIQDVLFKSDEGKRVVSHWMRGAWSSTNVLQYIEDCTGIPYKELEGELRRSSENMVFINDAVINKIQVLRAKGVNVVIATDNMDIFELITVPSLRLRELFDGVIVSSNQGALKNEITHDNISQFFSLYLQQHNLNMHESVLIDDSLDTKVVELLGIDFLHVDAVTDLSSHLDDILRLID